VADQTQKVVVEGKPVDQGGEPKLKKVNIVSDHPVTVTFQDGRQQTFLPGEQEVPEELADHYWFKHHLEGAEVTQLPPGHPAYMLSQQDIRRRHDALTAKGDQEAIAERARLLAGQHESQAYTLGQRAVVGPNAAPFDGSANLKGKSGDRPGLGRGDVEVKDPGLTANVQERPVGQDSAKVTNQPQPKPAAASTAGPAAGPNAGGPQPAPVKSGG
jgi:hypothetical protein